MINNYKRKKEPVENRKLILEAAVDLAGHLELSQISFDALSKKCGLSKGGIIHHFPNRDTILHTLFKESMDEFTIRFHKELDISIHESPALTYLRLSVNDSKKPKNRKMMKLIFKCLVNNEAYCQIWNRWVTEHILKGLTEEEKSSALTILLIADGLWYGEVLGLHLLNSQQKEQLIAKYFLHK